MPGCARRDGGGQRRRRGDRRVRVAAGPDVGHGHARRPSASDVGEGVEHRRRPMVGQRLVDGPDPPARLALADRRERRADGGRVVAVVVVDHDAGRLALALEAAADAARTTPRPARDRRPGRRPRTAAAAGDRQGVGRVVAAGRGQADRDRAGQRVEPVELQGRARPGRCRRPGRGCAAPGRRRREPLGDRPRVAAQRCGAWSTSAYATTARASRRGGRRRPATPGSPTLATSVGAGAACGAASASNAATTAAASANTSGWSHSALVRTAMSGR